MTKIKINNEYHLEMGDVECSGDYFYITLNRTNSDNTIEGYKTSRANLADLEKAIISLISENNIKMEGKINLKYF